MQSLVQVTEVYQERRLDAVFAMWDQNSDLRISFKELCEGLYRYKSRLFALPNHTKSVPAVCTRKGHDQF